MSKKIVKRTSFIFDYETSGTNDPFIGIPPITTIYNTRTKKFISYNESSDMDKIKMFFANYWNK